jgi:hypothetical protein
MRKRKTLEARLWAKVDQAGPTDCWLWTGGTTPKGYGTIKVESDDGSWKTGYAHQEALRLAKGGPADPAHQALHSCDNPPCCNPAHLNWGSNSQNRREARDRLHNQGRQKLLPADVISIKADRRIYDEIAATYSVHPDTIARIKQGRSWQP